MRKFTILILSCFFILSCGGGGGGGEKKIEYISTVGFTASSDNIIEAGQKRFSFGQTSNFKASGIENVADWSCLNGSIDSSGQYVTPHSISDHANDTISLMVNGVTYTRDIELFTSPAIKSDYFLYNNGNQRYAIHDLESTQAVGLGVFQNGVESQGDITIKQQVLFNKKDEKSAQSDGQQPAKMKFGCGATKKTKKNKTSRSKSSKEKVTKRSRADDPVGTRDTFYSAFDEEIVLRDFEKIYSGPKCLIYSEIDTTTSLPYIAASSISEFAKIFETENPYHPEKKPIFNTVIEHFGNPWGIDIDGNKINGGGVDGEAPILILICIGDPSIGGIFYPDDEAPAGVNEEIGFVSNGAEIVYLNQQLFSYPFLASSVLAHEFQHLCNFNQSYLLDGDINLTYIITERYLDLELVFNEGLSVLAEELSGFGLNTTSTGGNGNLFFQIDFYLASLSTSFKPFIAWEGGPDDYGKAYLFWKFIYETYGVDAIKSINISHEPPPKNVEIATNKKFDELIQEFLIAILQSDSDTPVKKELKLNIDRSGIYYGESGTLIGGFNPIKYVNGFPGGKIYELDPYVFRLFKLKPKNGVVSFVLSDVKEDSNTSIGATLIKR